MGMLTDQELTEIRERCEKATRCEDDERFADGRTWQYRTLGKEYQVYAKGLLHVALVESIDDASLIARAIDDIPALLAEVERLKTRPE